MPPLRVVLGALSPVHPHTAGVEGKANSDLELVPTRSGPQCPHSSLRTLLALPTAACFAESWSWGSRCPSVLSGMTGVVLLGADQNSCLGLLGLSLSYFHPQQRGGNSSGPWKGRERGRVNQGLTSSSGPSPTLCPAQAKPFWELVLPGPQGWWWGPAGFPVWPQLGLM